MASRSDDGEVATNFYNHLSVSYADSSPRGEPYGTTNVVTRGKANEATNAIVGEACGGDCLAVCKFKFKIIKENRKNRLDFSKRF